MPFAGLPHSAFGQSGIFVHIESSTNDVDVHALASSPAGEVYVRVLIDSGVIVGASEPSAGALILDNLPTGSVVHITNNGLLEGAGGDGGASYSSLGSGICSGGGGGGSGTTPGLGSWGGGVGDPFDSKGDDGVSGLLGGGDGGPNGAAVTENSTTEGAWNGEAGGAALTCGDKTVIIENPGFIYGGGGGGGGGGLLIETSPSRTTPQSGGDGGDPGEAGVTADPQVPGISKDGGTGGAAGAAVTGSGSVTFNSGGTSPNVEGAVP